MEYYLSLVRTVALTHKYCNPPFTNNFWQECLQKICLLNLIQEMSRKLHAGVRSINDALQ